MFDNFCRRQLARPRSAATFGFKQPEWEERQVEVADGIGRVQELFYQDWDRREFYFS